MRHCQNGSKKEAANPCPAAEKIEGKNPDAAIIAISYREKQSLWLQDSGVSRGLWEPAIYPAPSLVRPHLRFLRTVASEPLAC